jgi:hypothetical protein
MKRNICRNANIVIIFLASLATSIPASSQVDLFQQKAALDSLKRSLDYLYNFEFDKATTTINDLNKKYPDHPALNVFHCLFIYWKNFPLSEHPQESVTYTQSLESALAKAEAFLKQNADDPERMFYCLFLDVLLARQNAAEDHTAKAIRYTRKAFYFIKRGFILQDIFNEFYFSTGFYDYYREFFPEQHPGYKIISWIFPSGSKVKGLQYLDKAVTQTVFVMPEALTLTSAINLKYENNLPKALFYADLINKKYPGNPYFKVLYIENLIQSGMYKEAEANLTSLATNNGPYYQLPVALFNGLLQERYYKKPEQAEKWYQAAIRHTTGWDTDNYVGLAYYGLGNIYKSRADMGNAKKYYKKANSLCEYLSVKKATEDY